MIVVPLDIAQLCRRVDSMFPDHPSSDDQDPQRLAVPPVQAWNTLLQDVVAYLIHSRQLLTFLTSLTLLLFTIPSKKSP
jgi:hypothetical protein